MGLGDNLVSTAVEEAFEQSGIEPGELNNKIDRVMETMEQANMQLDDADEFQQEITQDIKAMQESAEVLAEASTTLAEASISISESADGMKEAVESNSEDLQDLNDEIQNLNNTMEKVQNFIEENTE